jgi:hypothetical protein
MNASSHIDPALSRFYGTALMTAASFWLHSRAGSISFDVESQRVTLKRVAHFGDLLLLEEDTIVIFGTEQYPLLARLGRRSLDFADNSRSTPDYVHVHYGRWCTYHNMDGQQLVLARQFVHEDFRVFTVDWALADCLQFGYQRRQPDPELDRQMFAFHCRQCQIDPAAADAATQLSASLRAIHFESTCRFLGVDATSADAEEQVRQQALKAERGEIGYHGRRRVLVDLPA